jgi:4-azaleucine resistance transporter AzlC
MPTARSEFMAGMRAELPILIGTVPFGLIYGVSALGSGVPRAVVQAMSVVVFAGSAQFVTAQFLGAGVPGLIVVLTAFVINLRHALYSASVAPYVRRLPPRWKGLLAYLLTDEAYAVAISHYLTPGDIAKKRWYFLGAGLALWSAWQVSTAVGVFLGAQVPASWSLDFTLPLTFIALVVPTLRDRAGIAAALVAGLAATMLVALPLKSGLLLAAFAGIGVGLALELRQARRRATADGASQTPLEPSVPKAEETSS